MIELLLLLMKSRSLSSFADDIVLIHKSECGWQNMLQCLHQCCVKWKLQVNMDKNKWWTSDQVLKPERQAWIISMAVMFSKYSHHLGI